MAICTAEILASPATRSCRRCCRNSSRRGRSGATQAGWLAGSLFAGYMLGVVPLVTLTDTRVCAEHLSRRVGTRHHVGPRRHGERRFGSGTGLSNPRGHQSGRHVYAGFTGSDRRPMVAADPGSPALYQRLHHRHRGILPGRQSGCPSGAGASLLSSRLPPGSQASRSPG